MNRPLEKQDLRRFVDPRSLSVESTRELEPLEGIIGQKRAVEALRFGLGIDSLGFNIYVAGPPGIGKMTSVKAFLEEMAAKQDNPPDWCYVYNFSDPYKPKALRLAAGRGTELKRDMEHLVKQVQQDLRKSFESEEYANRRQQALGELQRRRESILQQVQQKAQAEGFRMQLTPMGIVLIPVRDGQPLNDEQFNELPAERQEEIRGHRRKLTEEVQAAMKQIRRLEKQGNQELKELDERVVLNMLGGLIDDLKEKYGSYEQVVGYLAEAQAVKSQ